MIYEYSCDKCDKTVDVVKPMAESGTKEKCQDCGNVMSMVFSRKTLFIGTSVRDAEYYPSLGKVIKNDYARKEEIKKHGLIEVGNETPKAIKHHTTKHRLAKIARDYDED